MGIITADIVFIICLGLPAVRLIPVYPSVADTVDYWESGQRELENWIAKDPVVAQAKNVIFFIGDGMGLSTEAAARAYQSELRNLSGQDALLSWQRMPVTGTTEVSTTNFMVPDSAGSTTAFVTGWKTRTGTIGVNSQVPRGDCAASANNHLSSVLKYSIDAGKWTGVVSTARVTHATPAALYAHSADRDWESDADLPAHCRTMVNNRYVYPDIASQIVDDETAQQIRVILGGGRRSFYPAGTPDVEGGDMGRRLDNRSLVDEWVEQKVNMSGSRAQVRYVENERDFHAVNPSTTDYLLGLFEASHMRYEADRIDPNIEQAGEPSLADMTEKAIRMLERSRTGYFLFIESGRIDHAHHANLAMKALNDTVAMSDAVEVAKQLTSAHDTLIVISADHSHAFTFNGYPSQGRDILDNVDNATHDETALALDGKPWMALGYHNGPGFYYHRSDNGTEVPRRNTINDTTVGDKSFVYDTGVPLISATHSGEDVGVYAQGPMAHLLVGHHKNIHVAHVLMYASCIGLGLTFCNDTQSVRDPSEEVDCTASGVVPCSTTLVSALHTTERFFSAALTLFSIAFCYRI